MKVFVKRKNFIDLRIAWTFLIILSASLVAFGCGASQQTASGLSQYELDDIRIVSRPNPGGAIVSVSLFFDGGRSSIEAGESVAIEDVLMRCVGDSDRMFRKAARNIGFRLSASTEADYSQITMTCSRENWDSAWKMFARLVLHPHFIQNKIDSEKQILINALAFDTEPYQFFRGHANAIYFKGHPYDFGPILQDVAALDSQALKSHYAKMLQRSRMLISMVGDVTTADLSQKVHDTFGDLPKGDWQTPEIPLPQHSLQKKVYNFTGPPAQKEDYVMAYLPLPELGSKGWYAAIRLRLWFRANLYRVLAIDHNLTKGVREEERLHRFSYFLVWFKTYDPQRAIEVATKEIERLSKLFFPINSGKRGMAEWLTTRDQNLEESSAQSHALGEAAILSGDASNATVPFGTFDEINPMKMEHAARELTNVTWFVMERPR